MANELYRGAFDEDSTSLRDTLAQLPWHDLTIMCVGTDRSTGDSLGPLVGTKLKQRGIDVPVFGTLDEPVHAVNIHDYNQRIKTTYAMGIDACLGKFDHVGHIILENEPLRPGAGVKKDLPHVGQWCLTGVVNVCGFMEYFVLQNTRLSMVMRMADVIADAIYSAVTESVVYA